jgi:hypothetical protein
VQVAELSELLQNSPFLDHHHPFNAYEWFKIFLFLPWLVVRCMLCILIAPWVIGYVALVIRGYPRDEPLAEPIAKRLAGIIQFWGRALLVLGCHFWSVKVLTDGLTA